MEKPQRGFPKREILPIAGTHLSWLITDDGSRTLMNHQIDETYHSSCGAISESIFVYLRNSLVLQRLSQCCPTTVLEYGFGTGTNFLVSAAAAEYFQSPLNYVALDNCFLGADILESLDLQTAIDRAGELQRAVATIALSPAAAGRPDVQRDGWSGIDISFLRAMAPLLQRWQEIGRQSQNMKIDEINRHILSEHVRLTLLACDATQFRIANWQRLGMKPGDCQAIYFDPFSPESMPEFWTEQVYMTAWQLLSLHGRLTSYCIKSVVRRALERIGFEVTRTPGPPGGKREVLVACKPE